MDNFDFIIVGGGSAGCVLANRLSEDSRNSVCLIEAGPEDKHWVLKIPSGVAAALNRTEFSWGYESTSQAGLGNRPFKIPRGKVLGGSSSVNGMVYFRGHPGDFDDWAANGAPGWSYAEVLPYFIRSENNLAIKDSPYHGYAGEMAVSDPPRPNPLVRSFLEATRGLDLKPCADFNAADPEGFGFRQATIRKGRRESMATAFIRPAEKRSNLTILTEALVDKVVIEHGRAVGVAVNVGGEKRTINARREIILSGGAYGSPAVLLRSGVGDAQSLRALGIRVQVDLPNVGRGLRDHPSAAIQMKTTDATSYGLSLRAMPRNFLNLMEYLLLRTGPVGGNVFEATGFVRTQTGLNRPDLQLVFMPAHRNPNTFPIPLGHGFGILSIAARPKSVGSVSLSSSDPTAKPLIDPRFFEHPDDLRVVRDGLRLARRILGNDAFARYAAHQLLPTPDTADDDDAWNDFIRRSAVTVHHPGCSLRMGSDEGSVVDPTLRVRGIEGLRVADASVFPTLIAGNTNAAVVMIAEKAADMILNRPAPASIPLPHAG